MAAISSNPFVSEAAVLDAEHISLQSESDNASSRQSGKPVAKYQLRSRTRGTLTRVEILEGHFVKILSKRARTSPQEHTVDLHFVDPRPIGIRKVGWPWMYVAI